MKEWNKPELAVMEISETAVNHNKSDYESHYSDGYCTITNTHCQKGNGAGNKKGICNNCNVCNCGTTVPPIPTVTTIPENSLS